MDLGEEDGVLFVDLFLPEDYLSFLSLHGLVVCSWDQHFE